MVIMYELKILSAINNKKTIFTFEKSKYISYCKTSMLVYNELKTKSLILKLIHYTANYLNSDVFFIQFHKINPLIAAKFNKR